MRGGATGFLQETCKGQSVHLDFPLSSYYFAKSPRLCRSFIPPAIMAIVIILLNLSTRMLWLAAKEENYFLSPLHPSVAFNWMQSVLSSLPKQTLKCGL